MAFPPKVSHYNTFGGRHDQSLSGQVLHTAFGNALHMLGAAILSGHDLVDVPIEGGSIIPYRTSRPIGAIGDAVEAVLERLPTGERPRSPLTFEDRVIASQDALDRIAAHARTEDAGLFVYNATTPERAL